MASDEEIQGTDEYPYGSKSVEARAFHIAVYETIQRVPHGHVTSYGERALSCLDMTNTGHIAMLIGAPDSSRRVGFALKHLPRRAVGSDTPADQLPVFNSETVPWWRIVNAQGRVSQAPHRQHQVVKLREEIPVEENGAVDFDEYGWFPLDLD